MPARRQSQNRTRRDAEETRSDRESPSGLISQTNAADWILACRKMDRSLWITDYRPPLPSISPRHRIVPSYRRDVHRPLLRFALPAGPLRPSRRRFHLRGRFPSSGQLGNLPHAYAAATLSLSLLHPVVTGISNLMSATTKSIETVKCREIDGSIKHPC